MWPFASKEDVHAEVNQLRDEFSQSLQTMQLAIISEIRSIPQPPSPIIPAIPDIPDVSPEIVQLSKRVFDLQQQVNVLAQMVNQLAVVTPTSELKQVHPAINDRIQMALRAVEAIGQTHATWLEDYVTRLGPMLPLMQEEAERHNQGQAIIKQLIIDMSPPEEQKDTEPIEQV